MLDGGYARRPKRAVDRKLLKEERRRGSLRPAGEAFLAVLERDQRRLLRLCAALESLADRLPAATYCGTSRTLAFLGKAYDGHVFLHDRCLFPLMRSLAGPASQVEPVLAQLEFEHASDRCLIIEINSVFQNGAPTRVATDTFGYLLRSFFENCRRHRAWETAVIYPVARRHLSDEAKASHHASMLHLPAGFGI
jgi:iron-sulfur cluster repair protein YtfE (RIC family)